MMCHACRLQSTICVSVEYVSPPVSTGNECVTRPRCLRLSLDKRGGHKDVTSAPKSWELSGMELSGTTLRRNPGVAAPLGHPRRLWLIPAALVSLHSKGASLRSVCLDKMEFQADPPHHQWA